MPASPDTYTSNEHLPTVADVEHAVTTLEDSPFVPLVVNNTEEYEEAADALMDVKRRLKQVKLEKERILKPLKDHRVALEKLFEPVEMHLERTETHLKEAMIIFTVAQERERRRIEAELRDAQEQERLKAEAKAKKLEAAGKMEQAEAARDNVSPVPIVVMDKPKVSGISTRETWHAEVTDFRALVAYAIKNGALNLLEPNMTTLNSLARSTKGNFAPPGVKHVKDTNMAVRV